MKWVLLGLELASLIGLVALTVGWLRLQRIQREIKRQLLLKDQLGRRGEGVTAGGDVGNIGSTPPKES